MLEDGFASGGADARRGYPGEGLSRFVDRVMLKRLARDFQGVVNGSLHLVLPSGENMVIGRAGVRPHATLTVDRYRGLWRLLRGGSLGFAEAFMDGDVSTSDLKNVFNFYFENDNELTKAIPAIEVTKDRDRFWHARRSNTRDGSRRNVAAHYDLGNTFYKQWLDPSLLYSSGIYRSHDDTLETAQETKLYRILSALELRAGLQMLEIGCGWGALAEAAGRAGASVRAITISEQQLVEAKARITDGGLGSRVGVHFEDYRDTTGIFDRLVSIEMIEAVGEDNWPLFFETISQRLAPGGLAVIQAITIRDDAFDRYRANPDFIQRYIFPGGMLPTIPLMERRATEANLEFETVERFGASYALTLREWRRRFEAAWPRIAGLGFDERFRRMWLYYLIYCEVGFERGLIDVGLYRMRKPV